MKNSKPKEVLLTKNYRKVTIRYIIFVNYVYGLSQILYTRSDRTFKLQLRRGFELISRLSDESNQSNIRLGSKPGGLTILEQ